MNTGTRGFSLLELMVAMAILAFALVALLGHQGVAIQMSDYSNRVSQATFLAEGKMLDIEHKLLKDSIDSLDNCEDGDFREEGFRRYRWKACAFPLEIQEGAGEQLTERFSALFMGFAGGDAAGAGSAMGASGAGAGGMSSGMERAMGQLAMATGMIPSFLQQLEDQIRKVRLEVTWRDQVQERRLLIERFITALGRDDASGEPPKDDLAREQAGQIQDEMMNNGVPPPMGGK